jgi:hypothetical protein
MANEYNPIAQAFRGFAIGVADGAAASNHPAGRMFGTAMQGAMSPVYQAQQLDLERAQAIANEEDYFGMDPTSDFEMVEPNGKEFMMAVKAMQHAKGMPEGPKLTDPTITLNTGLE